MGSRQELHARRPTSPHLTIYKPQISSTLSIFHRLTGVALFFALSILSWWMIIIQFNGFCECTIYHCLLVRLALYAISYAAVFHLLSGIRHLFWDAGYGFSLKAVDITGWLVIIFSVLITVIFWGYML